MNFVDQVKSSIGPGSRVLVIDDSIATRRIFHGILKLLGFEIDEADDGHAALEMLKNDPGKYTLIFSDISMPNMDGFELCHRLQEAEWFEGTPFVLVSTDNDAPNVIRGLKLGADDFMPKPFDKEVIAQVVQRVLLASA